MVDSLHIHCMNLVQIDKVNLFVFKGSLYSFGDFEIQRRGK